MLRLTRGRLSLFSVDDRSAQVIWNGRTPGPVAVRVTDPGGRQVREPVTLEARGDGPVAMTIDGLPPGTELVVRARPETSGADAPIPFRTDRSVPGEEMARVATIGDLHLGSRAFGHRRTITEPIHPDGPAPVRCTRAALDEAADWGAERVIAKGDVTDGASAREWATWAGLVRRSRVPVDSLPGNHDSDHPKATVAVPAPVAGARHGFSVADPIIVRDHPGLRIVALDTCIPGSNRGSIARVLVDLLDVAADTEHSTALLVAIHHQLHPRTGAEGWPIGIPHREALDAMERLARIHPRSLITSGHTHRNRRWSHAGITTTQVGSATDHPGVWAGYVAHEGGIRQVVRRIEDPSCMAWTERCGRAVGGAWRVISPGPAGSRDFALRW